MDIDGVPCTPPELRNVADEVSMNLLHKKSRVIYAAAYDKFHLWRIEKNAPISENVILAYLTELSKKLKRPSLWANYSFLKAKILLNDKINIGTYSIAFSFLKRNAEGYKPKKAKILQNTH